MSVPYMPLYVADYLGDTQHLTTEQHGAYLLLLMTMWRSGGRLPNEPVKLARIARVHPRRWHLVGADVMNFFDVEGDEIVQRRLEREHKKAISISQKRSVSGKLGGNAKALKSRAPALANAKQMPYYSEPEPKEAKASCPKQRKRVSYPEEFEAFWKLYPTDQNMGKQEALEEWLRLSPEDRKLAAAAAPNFRTYCTRNPDYRPLHANRFLSRRRFEGFASATPPGTADEGRLWAKRLQHGRTTHSWAMAEWGPMPGQAGCRAPQELLIPTDGEGWTEWKTDLAA